MKIISVVDEYGELGEFTTMFADVVLESKKFPAWKRFLTTGEAAEDDTEPLAVELEGIDPELLGDFAEELRMSKPPLLLHEAGNGRRGRFRASLNTPS